MEDNVEQLPGTERLSGVKEPWTTLLSVLIVVLVCLITVVPWALGIAVMAKAVGVEI